MFYLTDVFRTGLSLQQPQQGGFAPPTSAFGSMSLVRALVDPEEERRKQAAEEAQRQVRVVFVLKIVLFVLEVS